MELFNLCNIIFYRKMKTIHKRKIRHSVILLIVILITSISIFRWAHNLRQSSDKIIREHIIRGIGLDIKDRLDLSERAIDTLVETYDVHRCIKGKGDPETEKTISNILSSFKTLCGASLIYVMDRKGLVVCSTQYADGKTLRGNNYSFRYYFRAALKGREILYPAVGVTTGKRGVYISKPVRYEGEIIGVAVIKIDMNEIDRILHNSGKILLLSTPDGIVFSSSSEEFLLKAIKPLSSAIRKKIELNRQYPDLSPEILNIRESYPLTVGQQSYRVVKRNIPIPDWSLTLLTPSSKALSPLTESHSRLFILIGILLFLLYAVLQFLIIYCKNR